MSRHDAFGFFLFLLNLNFFNLKFLFGGKHI